MTNQIVALQQNKNALMLKTQLLNANCKNARLIHSVLLTNLKTLKRPIRLLSSASTTDASKEHLEWHPIRHPMLPTSTTPYYFVNKNGDVCSKYSGTLKPLAPWGYRLSYRFQVDGKSVSIKKGEIMAYTFPGSQVNNSDELHIFYKDGDRKNCAWDNMIICNDFTSLQQLEIARLEKLYPGKKYTVVRNIHDTLTFERYLVADDGDIYSIIKHSFIKQFPDNLGYNNVYMQPDHHSGQPKPRKLTIPLHSVVLQSFRGRRVGNARISHINGDKLDSSLDNLEFTTGSVVRSRTNAKKRGDTHKKETVRPPLPPVTEETRWKPIGVLPWNGRRFSRYEVSDMGHVRWIGGTKLVKQTCPHDGYPFVGIFYDEPDVKSDDDVSGPRAARCLQGVSVSRLVANAFVDGYKGEKDIVMHINGDPKDCRAQNLRWDDRASSNRTKLVRRVKVSLVDDPTKQEEFPSMSETERRLSIHIKHLRLKDGQSVVRKVIWNGKTREALIEVF